MTISEILSKFSIDLSFSDIPGEVTSKAKELILDGAGIALASSTYSFADATLAGLRRFGEGSEPVIGCGARLALRDAALMNGILVHGLDYDDTHLEGVVHPTSSCFPCAMGLAGFLDRSGSDFLAAYIAALEVSGRLGKVAKGELNQVGFHPTGVIAAFGCAIAASRLFGLDAEKTTMAQGIVLSMAAGSREYSADGSWSKRLHPGWAAVGGITAAGLAAEGFTGPRTAYEGKFGLYATHLGTQGRTYDLSAATAGFFDVWETLGIAIKPFPACQLSIACIDAALALARNHAIDPLAVERIEAVIPPHAVAIVCEPVERRLRPESAYAAQFSLPFVIACALVHKRMGLAELQLFDDAALLDLAAKVTYRVDHNTNYPRHFSGEVIVNLKDGRVLSHREEVNRGARERPVSAEDVEDKFFQNAELAVDRQTAVRIRDLILSIEKTPNVRELIRELAIAKQ
ncbi:MmgE/PrpD family protein [Pseudochelatococcus sp. B33]